MFLDKKLTDDQLANVVKYSTFKNMRKNPKANYEQVTGDLFSRHQGRFMRKGTSQSEPLKDSINYSVQRL